MMSFILSFTSFTLAVSEPEGPFFAAARRRVYFCEDYRTSFERAGQSLKSFCVLSYITGYFSTAIANFSSNVVSDITLLSLRKVTIKRKDFLMLIKTFFYCYFLRYI